MFGQNNTVRIILNDISSRIISLKNDSSNIKVTFEENILLFKQHGMLLLTKENDCLKENCIIR